MIYLLIPFILIRSVLFSEIVDIEVLWNPLLCKEKCPAKLQTYFTRIPYVKEAYIDAYSGKATLLWKEDAPYGYHEIKREMQRVGLAINDMRITVRGEIIFEGGQYAIRSLGDGSIFTLSEPTKPRSHQDLYLSRKSASKTSLTTETEQNLKRLMQTATPVSISGPLNFYYRPDPTLMIQSIQDESLEPPAQRSQRQ